MRLARFAIQDPLAAIDAGDLSFDRHVETAEEITGAGTRIDDPARRANGSGVGADPVENLLWRRDVVALQPVYALHGIVALRRQHGDAAAPSVRVEECQCHRHVAVTMESDEGMAVVVLRQRHAVEFKAHPWRRPCQDKPALDGGAGAPFDAFDRGRKR